MTAQSNAVVSRSPHWWLRLLLAVLVGAALVGLAELALRAIIPTVIANVVREQMSLAPDHPVEVELAGPALFPALTGHVNNVTLRVSDVEVFEGIHTDLYAAADSVPFDPTHGDILGATASVTIPEQSLDTVVSLVSDGLIKQGTVHEGKIELGSTMPMFGYDVQLSATLALAIEGGELLVQPVEIKAAGFDLTAEQLRPLLGPVAAPLLDTHTVCVRDKIPAGITLTRIDLRPQPAGGSATVSARLDPDILSNPQQQQPGSCTAP